MVDSSECKIYHDNEYVSWTIPRKSIENTLVGKDNGGLLFLNVESAGEIEFKDSSCKIDIKNQKVCDKKMTKNLKFKNGNSDSVLTPLSVVNFHTHPLSCYIEAETIWGWPSGEDLAQCLNFANDNNLTHVIFAVEGTYVIDVNKDLIKYLKSNTKLYNLLNNNIEEIFKLTHKHRMLTNDSNPNIKLDNEFNEIFLKPLGIKPKKNILLSWIYLVNNLTIESIIILSNEFSKYFKDIRNMKNIKESKYLNIKIFSIDFFKNNTIQWNENKTKNKIFSELNKGHKNKNFKIILPKEIKYKAPFISQNCKL